MPETREAESTATEAETYAEDIRICVDGNDVEDEAFTRLYEHYQPLLLSFVRAKFRTLQYADAEDIVQEVFQLAHKKISTFRGESSFDSWLCSIAYHQAQNRFRGKITGQVNLAEERKYSLRGREPEAEEQLIGSETVQKIREAIQTLPPQFRNVVQDVEIDGMPYQECADHLHIPIGTVRSQLFRAKLLLKERLQSLTQQAT